MQIATSIVVPAVSGTALSYVVFGAVAFSLLMALVFLVTGSGESIYDQIGAGGLSRESDHGAGGGTHAPDSPAEHAEREREVRQMIVARSERLVRRGQPPLDVDAEVARLLAPPAQATTHEAGLVLEVRQLVVARNERRLRQGLEALDVEAEVKQTLAELNP